MTVTTDPWWWKQRPHDSNLNDEPPSRVDVLVIGAGYTGLSAAITAKDCGTSVAVIDAGTPGKGASTRNGGMAGAHPRVAWSAIASTYGADAADAIYAEAPAALQFVRDLIRREGIECDMKQSGRIQLAWTKSHFENQKRLADHIRRTSTVEVELIERSHLHKEIATTKYHGGMLFPEHCSLHPRKFHDGLMHSALKRNIPITANCVAHAISSCSGGYIVSVSGGKKIQAEKVIMATNGYTSKQFKWHTNRVFPVPSFIIATEKIDPAILSTLAPGQRMMVETRAKYSYFRLSPEGDRILYGGRAALCDISPQRAAQWLRRAMATVWPEMSDTKVSHVWSGNTGYTFNHLPNVGQNRGIHHAMGFSGSGVVLAPWLGSKVAFQAMDDTRGETGYAASTLRTSMLHPFSKPYFLYATDLWYRTVVDPLQSYQGR